MNQRANIYTTQLPVSKGTTNKTVHVYEDHRVILCALFDARQKQLLHGPANLVYFDYHADARQPSQDATIQARIQQYRLNLPSYRDFWAFVEFDSATDDGDWLKLGMELGLLGHAIVVGCVEDDGLAGEVTTYTDHAGVEHRIFNFGHLWQGAPHAWLTDAARTNVLSDAWAIMGWQHVGGHFQFTDEGIEPFVLDFDLDCFATPQTFETVPWLDHWFSRLFGQKIPGSIGDMRYGDFLQRLSALASFITIARESPYSGGFESSNRILSNVDRLLFNNGLTLPCKIG